MLSQNSCGKIVLLLKRCNLTVEGDLNSDVQLIRYNGFAKTQNIKNLKSWFDCTEDIGRECHSSYLLLLLK